MTDYQSLETAPLRAAIIPAVLMIGLIVMGYVTGRDASTLIGIASASLHVTLAAYLLAANLIPKAIMAFPQTSFIWHSRFAWAAFSVCLLLTLAILALWFLT